MRLLRSADAVVEKDDQVLVLDILLCFAGPSLLMLSAWKGGRFLESRGSSVLT